ncbi:pyridoxal-phosphate dependent enzyme [Stetteria hydrogenophila]
MGVRLVEIGLLRAEGSLELADVVDVVKRILWEGGVWRTVAVEGGRVVDGLEVYEALRRLGVSRVPVSDGRPVDVFVPLDLLGFFDEIRGDPYRVYDGTVELLRGNWPTPLFKLSSLSRGGYRVWAKWEAFNPFSWSIKDRVGWYMFTKALGEGRLPHAVYEATSTNTGIALASMAAVYGIKARLYLPSAAQKASDVILKVLGAEVVRKHKPVTVDFIGDVEHDAARDGASHLNQFENDWNFEVHLRYTAKELDLQLSRRGILPRAIIGGLGTSGHMSALALYFKSRYRGKVRVVGVQPARGHVISGLRRVETGMKWIHMAELDKVVDITREEAVEAAVRVARSEGILIGLSSGAVTKAFEKLAQEGRLEEGDYVLVYPDNGLKYLEQFKEHLKRRSKA